jgi:cell division protein FtsZ
VSSIEGNAVEKDKEKTGCAMQSKSHDHDNAHNREQAPDPHGQPQQGWAGRERPRMTPPEYDDQMSQWAVLRHEVEGEDMTRQNERVLSGWDQRDTEDDGTTSQTPLYGQDQLLPHYVDIVVVGVGGGGMNAVNQMVSTQVRGVRFIAMNTDAQVLALSQAQQRLCLGQYYTKGLGAGGSAAIGAKAATESEEEIRAALGNPDLVFIAAGMGGGTGTGSAPVIASIAKKLGALTVGIVTLPFAFEGTQRKRVAITGLNELKEEIDALIAVPNDRLLTTTGRDRSLAEAFKQADDVLRQGVQGIAEVINVPGMVNVDFADVRSVLVNAGTALMSIGQGQGPNRAQRAAEQAIAGGFLNVTIRGAQRVLFNISGGNDMTLFEVNEVAQRIGDAIDSTADITFGAVIDPMLRDTIRVTLIAAGMEEIHTVRLPAIRLDAARPIAQSNNAHPSQAGQAQVQRERQQSNTQPRPAIRQASQQSRPLRQPNQPQQSMPSRQSTPTQPVPPISPRQAAPNMANPPNRPLMPPGRQQRSLDDLRGIRSLGQRQETQRRSQTGPEDPEEEAVDVPPFMKRYP